MSESGIVRIAADIGGTFTDVVVADALSGELRTGKVLSTPDDFSHGVVTGIESVVDDFAAIGFLIHGTTAGLNNFLERKGARTALVTTEGFRDVYEIARANRPEMYDLSYKRPAPLVQRRDVFEVPERVLASGEVERALEARAVEKVAEQLLAGGYESIAVVLIHAYSNPEHELMVERILAANLDGVSISLSHRVAREYREYERTSSTVINAYIAPVMERYLKTLERELAVRGYKRPIHIMRSGGGSMTSSMAMREAIHTLMSGPVGGTVGCRLLGQELGERHLICADMGGTSLDVSLVVDGMVDLETEGALEGFPILAPMVRVHSLGAGGGSIARVEARALHVGPESAGAEPGPACYGYGGRQPTVTDANVVAGRIDPTYFLGGRMLLDAEAAHDAVGTLTGALDLSVALTAQGILQVIDAVMANAIRTVTIGKGWDPREFALVAYGGAGPLHAAFLAQELQIRKVIVPASPGTFSARGMLGTDLRHDLVSPVLAQFTSLDPATLDTEFDSLGRAATSALREQGVAAEQVTLLRSADIRYLGQEYFVNIECPRLLDARALEELLDDFHVAYEQRYGHCNPDEAAEVVNLRLTGIGGGPRRPVAELAGVARACAPAHQASALETFFAGGAIETPLYRREGLLAGHTFAGPAIVVEDFCTTVVPPGFDLAVDDKLNLILTVAEEV
jgi:N-methylhydantoinase A